MPRTVPLGKSFRYFRKQAQKVRPRGGSGAPASIMLQALTLSASSYYGGAAPGTVIGAIQNTTPGSTLSLPNDGGGAVAISGSNLVVGLTAPTINGTFGITIRETLAGASNTPRDTPLTITTLWTPLVLGSAVVAWWDASDASTLSLSGSNVTAWASKAGGITASQASGVMQPLYSATARNGLPGVTFTTTQGLTMSSIAGIPQGVAASSVAAVGYGSGNTATGNQVMVGWGTQAQGEYRILGYNNNAQQIWYSNFAGVDAVFSELWTSVDRIVTVQQSTTSAPTLTWTVDGGTPVSANPGGATVNTGSAGGALGNSGGFLNGFEAIFQEVVIVNRVLTTLENQQFIGYLAWKWALQALLPGGFPYKNSPP